MPIPAYSPRCHALTPPESALHRPYLHECRRRLAQGPDATTSGLFDPLAAEHHSALIRHRYRPDPSSLATATLASSSAPAPPPPDSDLDDDFLPPLPPPSEPVPKGYRPSQDPSGTEPKYVTMAGYPPPPTGPLPSHAPQMEPPHVTAAKRAHAAAGSGAGSTGAASAAAAEPAKQGPVVSAAPQIRDLQRETTALVPTAVRAAAGADGGAKRKRIVVRADEDEGPKEKRPATAEDEAYQAFMREMEGLL
ncbi:hypothetical protein AMAG_06435 [Allomyces macrogynus ATCC 38327]|uniref:Uncharacterized protein n=1 Tax=Allomyces macrogynus (strain ATCC 38327) TaxID=578462 RepID=A0A0L0SGY6_ALLM3|nr:hypothetical protein AMAG_06435 [Allomyces macrogynus ATCC 38327]|eukprot:KNE61625.1 hypothetical protein AMAG_06435 [Allomyces macrogynus ATCC 38327]